MNMQKSGCRGDITIVKWAWPLICLKFMFPKESTYEKALITYIDPDNNRNFLFAEAGSQFFTNKQYECYE
jgi:hypothetical protein